MTRYILWQDIGFFIFWGAVIGGQSIVNSL